ncbi:hypothetical protein BSNK01_26250 [Bacillaceae bacterium]
MRQTVPIYTIGYGHRNISEFISLLKNYGIQYLIDVRSKPSSRFNPDFSRANLEASLKRSNIRYVFMGNNLGGLPQNEECYTNGRVDYSKVEKQPFYQHGIARLRTAWEKQIPVAIMCTEGKPEECHRSKLIGQTLAKMSIPVAHIDQHGELLQHQEVIDRLTNGQLSLFENTFTSRKQYLK